MAAKSLLLVEGNDDKHVLLQLLRYHGVPGWMRSDRTPGTLEGIEVRDTGGVENEFDRIIEILDVVVDESDLETLGIIVDANSNPIARWQSIRDRLRALGFGCPDDHDRVGTIIDQAGRELVSG